MEEESKEETGRKEKHVKFADYKLSERTQAGLKKHGFVVPTDVQRQSLPWSLEGRDIVANAKTGSGKTLALIIPVSASRTCI